MLVVSTWLWGAKYSSDDVAKLASAVRRNLKQFHRFVCFSDRSLEIEGVECGIILDFDLLEVKGCFARLRMFDPSWQEGWFDDQIVNMDLDSVVTGPLDKLFDRPEPFVILQGGNYANPCPYGGALFSIRRGAHPEIWSSFSLEAAAKVPFHEFPDDQGWMHAVAPGAAAFRCGPSSGVYVFRKPPWPLDDRLPADAKIVTFSGWRTPAKFVGLDWIRKNWL